jgi:hypothetical protein
MQGNGHMLLHRDLENCTYGSAAATLLAVPNSPCAWAQEAAAGHSSSGRIGCSAVAGVLCLLQGTPQVRHSVGILLQGRCAWSWQRRQKACTSMARRMRNRRRCGRWRSRCHPGQRWAPPSASSPSGDSRERRQPPAGRISSVQEMRDATKACATEIARWPQHQRIQPAVECGCQQGLQQHPQSGARHFILVGEASSACNLGAYKRSKAALQQSNHLSSPCYS